jgi:hypothetical protein
MTTTVTKADLHGSGSPPPSFAPARSAPTQSHSTPTQKNAKLPGTGAQRIDVEPIYTALKISIGEDWPLYKLTVAEFVLGTSGAAGGSSFALRILEISRVT